jgi:hypothetical protein
VADPLTKPGGETFLSRWSRRKHAAVREATAPSVAPAADAQAGAAATPPVPSAVAVPPAPDAVLPPVESLTFDSDFTPFLRPGVAPELRRSALRALLRDPHFNTMDGLDVYIDDYTKPSPLSAATIAGMAQARYIFAPPQTRVNADGVVEDVPAAAEAAADEGQADGGQAGDRPAVANTGAVTAAIASNEADDSAHDPDDSARDAA